MDDVLEILKLARDKEIMRKAAYEEAAAKTNNPLSQATFKSLAEQEDRHREYIEKYYEKQKAQECWPAPEEMGVQDEDMMAVVKEIFHHATDQIKEAGAASADISEAYAAGINAERESIEFYQDAGEKATDPNARKFFAVLTEAERWHLKLLSKTQEFLDAPNQWFFEEEQWGVTG